MTYEEAVLILTRDRALCMFNPWTGENVPIDEDCRMSAEALELAIAALEKQIPKGIIVDAVPVVRCKDCIHSYDDLCGLCCTCGPYVDCVVHPEFYCADGKSGGAARGVE